MIAMMKETEYMQKPTFLKNAWAALKDVLGRGHAIKCLEKCDFSPIFEWHLQKKEAVKALSREVGAQPPGTGTSSTLYLLAAERSSLHSS